jgi:hypothetical protein
MQAVNLPPPDAIPVSAPVAKSFLSSTEGELALVIVGLGVLVIIALTFALRFKQGSADDAIRAYTITLIVIGTLVLICAGYSNDQIAPAMGLFGTVAGYLLGRKGAQG